MAGLYFLMPIINTKISCENPTYQVSTSVVPTQCSEFR